MEGIPAFRGYFFAVFFTLWIFTNDLPMSVPGSSNFTTSSILPPSIFTAFDDLLPLHQSHPIYKVQTYHLLLRKAGNIRSTLPDLQLLWTHTDHTVLYMLHLWHNLPLFHELCGYLPIPSSSITAFKNLILLFNESSNVTFRCGNAILSGNPGESRPRTNIDHLIYLAISMTFTIERLST